MKITIITVTLNDLINLKKTANSVINQNEKDLQWIIKDGLSDDGTDKYVSELQKTIPNIDYIRRKDSSLYDAMNQAIPNAIGDYILFLNSGDMLYSENTIKKVIESIDNDEELDFVYGDNIDEFENGYTIYKKSRKLDYLKHSLPTSHQSIFYNKKNLLHFNYPIKYKICGDYALTASIYFTGNNRYKQLSFPISIFKLGGISQINRKLLRKEAFELHRKIVGDNILQALIKDIRSQIAFTLLDHFCKLYSKTRSIFSHSI